MGKARRIGDKWFAAARVTWDVGSLATLASASTTTTNLPGVKVGDGILVTPDAPATGFQYSGYVSAAGTVTLRATNGTSGTVDPASTTFTVQAFRFTT